VDSRTLIERLRDGAVAFQTDALTGKFLTAVARLMESDPLGLDWDSITSQLPDDVDFDPAELDKVAVALGVIAPDDEEASEAIAAWHEARPKRGRKTGGTRVASDSDNPVWTCITVTRDGQQVKRTTRNPGAISSLYDSTGSWLRSRGVTGQEWQPVREFIKNAAYSTTPGETVVGEFVVKVTF
jgi:hypothetical protein